MTLQSLAEPDAATSSGSADREKRGRRWVVWSFILCPCHLPVTLGVLGTVFGGSAFGPLIARNGLSIGLGISAVYAVGLGIGLRHIHLANKDIDCSTGECTIPVRSAD